MDFATGNGADTSGWWAVGRGSALSPSHISSKDSDNVSAGLLQEYSVLAGVAANMSSGFLLLNSQERVTYFNASAVRLLGINSHELIDQPIFDVRRRLLTLAAEPEQIQSELDRAWFSLEQEYTTDLALADAAVSWLRVRCFPMWDVQGQLLGRGVLLDDITLEHAPTESRNQMLALAAHQLKTPLAVIKGCATTLLGNSMRWDPTMQREMLQMIDTHADRLYDVLNTLLDVWRLDAGVQTLRLTHVNAAGLLRQLVERWRGIAPHHAFILNLPSPLAEIVVVCDAVRLEQALHLVLNNAVTYSPDRGTITMQLESNDAGIRLSIADEGVGIAPEHLDRIFDRFYRIQQKEERSSSSGSGLGLAVARATIEAHGGKIWADSAGLGQGATFYCTLPFTPRLSIVPVASQSKAQTQGVMTYAPTMPSATRSSGALKHSTRAYVLVAESDTRLTRYLRANLEEHSYRVQAVNAGVQLLRQLDLEEPDLLLLSMHLADMNGLKLLQRLREFSQLPVIMLCDECAEDERVGLLDLGADDLVIKPFGMKELLARVRALLRRQAIEGQQPTTQAIFTTGDLGIDYAQHQVFLQGRLVQLSRTEYKLLSTLAHNVGIVLTHEVLLERVWGPEYNREVDFIWVYISRLRRKIEADPRHPTYIVTVPDVGYKLAKL
jgi:DNA-binding response OmpR family regulator/signal transduction histidine kinase